MIPASHKIIFSRGPLVPALLLSLAVGISGQGATNTPTPYRVRVWQTDDGLPQNSVHAIAQTREGYLWVGTREGLARFEGVQFTLLDENAGPEPKNAPITAI